MTTAWVLGTSAPPMSLHVLGLEELTSLSLYLAPVMPRLLPKFLISASETVQGTKVGDKLQQHPRSARKWMADLQRTISWSDVHSALLTDPGVSLAVRSTVLGSATSFQITAACRVTDKRMNDKWLDQMEDGFPHTTSQS